MISTYAYISMNGYGWWASGTGHRYHTKYYILSFIFLYLFEEYEDLFRYFYFHFHFTLPLPFFQHRTQDIKKNHFILCLLLLFGSETIFYAFGHDFWETVAHMKYSDDDIDHFKNESVFSVSFVFISPLDSIFLREWILVNCSNESTFIDDIFTFYTCQLNWIGLKPMVSMDGWISAFDRCCQTREKETFCIFNWMADIKGGQSNKKPQSLQFMNLQITAVRLKRGFVIN